MILLVVASCVVFAGCNEAKHQCTGGGEHDFRDYLNGKQCFYCGMPYCEVYDKDHSFKSDGNSKTCTMCGKTEEIKNTEKDDIDDEPVAKEDYNIPLCIVLGVVLTICGLISHKIAIDASSGFFMNAPFYVFIIFTFGGFLTNIVYGIILTVFFVIYLALVRVINRRYLDYDDIIE